MIRMHDRIKKAGERTERNDDWEPNPNKRVAPPNKNSQSKKEHRKY